MIDKKLYKLLGLGILMILCLSTEGCRNSDFDLSNIDGTLGFGSDSISFPGNSSTDSIKLDDVLKLDNSDCVSILGNGDYVFNKENDDLAAANPIINKVSIRSHSINTYTVSMFSSSFAKRYSLRSNLSTASFNGKITAFNYSYSNVPSSILALDYMNVNSNITVTLSLSSELKRNISKLNTLVFTLPGFLDIGSASYNGAPVSLNANNQITLTNVSTANNIVIALSLKGMKMNVPENVDDNNTISFTKGESININGNVDINGTFDTSGITASIVPSECTIGGIMEIDDMSISGATGKFSPSIDFDNIGKVNLDNIPDFLNDNAVNMDLYNPSIILDVQSDLPLKGLISGTLTSKYDDKSDVSVNVPEFSINANTTTKVCICKNKAAIKDNYDEIVEVPNLSDIIKSIPKSITFGNITAKGDGSTTSTIQMGKEYTVKPTYKIEAPLAFSSDAKIVYNDTLDGWNKDVKKLNIEKEVQFTADVVNKVPVYLSVTAQAIDINKQPISNSDISIEVKPTVAAYNPVTKEAGNTQLVVDIKQNKDGAFKNFDGIIFKATGAAQADGHSAVEGVTINAYYQKLLLKNIKAKIVGKIIANL